MDSWIDFYDSAHSIYVNARHRDVHFRQIAQELAAYVRPGATVLDYGCGEALRADIVAAEAGRLILVELAPGVRARLEARFAHDPKIEVIGAPELARIPDHSVDLAIMHSVAQYLGAPELDAALALFRRLLAPGGLLVVGDVIRPQTSAVADALALLRFGAGHGFFFAALVGLVRTVLSPYRRLRATLGFCRYEETAFAARLAQAGFSAERAARNIGHNGARMTFLARPAEAGAGPNRPLSLTTDCLPR
ncbi:MAG TPA: methyltransferase domain-containing protein [Xanthobacteraceae bacterium]|nr:methyltransferase domain-containing protein [Xanthobacteraceae bacterium]